MPNLRSYCDLNQNLPKIIRLGRFSIPYSAVAPHYLISSLSWCHHTPEQMTFKENFLLDVRYYLNFLVKGQVIHF